MITKPTRWLIGVGAGCLALAALLYWFCWSVFLRDDSRMTLRADFGSVFAVAFSPDGKTIAAGGFRTRELAGGGTRTKAGSGCGTRQRVKRVLLLATICSEKC